MFRNYLKTAFRNLGKNKLYSGINIIGLAVGLTACLLIGVFISHELSYDKFNKQADSIVRITMEYNRAGTVNTTATTGTKVGPQFKRIFPAVEEYARTFISHGIIKYGEKIFDEQRILFADQPLFKIFSFQLIEGDASTVLDAPDKIVLTKSMAQKYFGNENAINKTISHHAGVNYLDITASTRLAVNDLSLVANDGLHPSGREYKVWAEGLLPIIKTALQ